MQLRYRCPYESLCGPLTWYGVRRSGVQRSCWFLGTHPQKNQALGHERHLWGRFPDLKYKSQANTRVNLMGVGPPAFLTVKPVFYQVFVRVYACRVHCSTVRCNRTALPHLQNKVGYSTTRKASHPVRRYYCLLGNEESTGAVL